MLTQLKAEPIKSEWARIDAIDNKQALAESIAHLSLALSDGTMFGTGILPDPEGLAAIAREAGIHVVLGAGFYTEFFLDAETLALSTEALTEITLGQLTDGAWGTGVRCGLIGEIGCSWPLTPFGVG